MATLRGAARAALADLIARQAAGLRSTSTRRRGNATPEPGPPRRRWTGPTVAAVSIAAVIAVIGAVWPSGSGPADAADHATATSAPTTRASSPTPPRREPTKTPAANAGPPMSSPSSAWPVAPRRTPGASSRPEPLAAAEELIVSAAHCAHDPAPGCEALWDGGASAAKAIRVGAVTPVLIEDYGDIAAVRNTVEAGAQMVVIIRRNAEWRIRDVYDIADPPSEAGDPER